MAYIIMTDSGADMAADWAEKYEIEIASLHYMLDGTEYLLKNGDGEGLRRYYARMREGAQASTSQVTPRAFQKLWEPHLRSGKDILMITMSQNLSGTYGSAVMARNELEGMYPNRRIELIDSLLCAIPQGVLVKDAAKLRMEGTDMDEVVAFLNGNRMEMNAVFVCEDVKYIKRSGRISSGKSLLASILSIKPIFRIDADGLAGTVQLARGMRRALDVMTDKIQEWGRRLEKQVIHIAHADSLQRAEELADKIREKIACKGVSICDMGPTIGAHLGPGMLGVAFYGIERFNG